VTTASLASREGGAAAGWRRLEIWPFPGRWTDLQLGQSAGMQFLLSAVTVTPAVLPLRGPRVPIVCRCGRVPLA